MRKPASTASKSAPRKAGFLIGKVTVPTRKVLNCVRQHTPKSAPLWRKPAKGAILPQSWSLRNMMSPVHDQGEWGTCTANAMASALEYLELLELKGQYGPDVFDDKAYDPISRLFVYWNEEADDGDPHGDNGSTISQSVNAVRSKGVCRESIWQYNSSNFLVCPVTPCYAEGYHHKALTDYQVDNSVPQNVMQAIASGYPVLIGFNVYQSFMGADVAMTGIVPDPSPGEAQVGGHAVLIVGYDQSKQQFIVKNSWGTGWGDGGYFYVSFNYFCDQNLAWDAWVVTR